MVELYTDFIKILESMKELSRMDSQRESTLCSLLQFALQYESQVMPDLGRIKATTLQTHGTKEGHFPAQFLLPQILDIWDMPM